MIEIVSGKLNTTCKFHERIDTIVFFFEVQLHFALSMFNSPVILGIIARAVEGQHMISGKLICDSPLVEITAVITLEKQRTTKLLKQFFKMKAYLLHAPLAVLWQPEGGNFSFFRSSGFSALGPGF
ncbi:hypothetical protein SAMN05660330_04443, partial [Desulforhopalus singaporensis]